LLESYFTGYLATLDALFNRPGLFAAERLMSYFTYWLETQATRDPKGRCLAVKLAAEVSDLSEAMRAVLEQGTDRAIGRLAGMIVRDGAPLESALMATQDLLGLSSHLPH
jgi:TetR/AcrR family transcriptional repressor of nem operon